MSLDGVARPSARIVMEWLAPPDAARDAAPVSPTARRAWGRHVAGIAVLLVTAVATGVGAATLERSHRAAPRGRVPAATPATLSTLTGLVTATSPPARGAAPLARQHAWDLAPPTDAGPSDAEAAVVVDPTPPAPTPTRAAASRRRAAAPARRSVRAAPDLSSGVTTASLEARPEEPRVSVPSAVPAPPPSTDEAGRADGPKAPAARAALKRPRWFSR